MEYFITGVQTGGSSVLARIFSALEGEAGIGHSAQAQAGQIHSATFYKGDGEHRNTDQTLQSI